MSEVMQQIDGLRGEVAGVNQRLGGVEQRLGGVEQRLGNVEQEMSGVKQRLGGVEQRLGAVETTLHNVVVEQSRARGDIEWLKQNMATRDELKTSFSLILDRIDGLAGKFEDSRLHSAQNLDRLDEHERRIAALEAKRA